MTTKTFAIDAAPGLIKRETGLAAVTASGYIGVQHDQGGAVVTSFVTVLTVEACDIASGDETYTFRLVGSNVADRSDAEVLDMAVLGDAGTIAIETRDTAAGDQIVMRARSEKNQDFFRYIDLHLTVAGTSPSITFGAYVSKELA